MSLETSRLLLRRLKPEDAEPLFDVVGDPKVMEFWAPGPDKTIRQTIERIRAINKHWDVHGFGDWALIEKTQNRLIGFCGLHFIADMKEVNVGYAIKRSKWQLGYGTEIVKLILDFGFNVLGLHEVVAVIDPRNQASIRLIQKCDLRYWKEGSYMGRARVIYQKKVVDHSCLKRCHLFHSKAT
jgi:ribosomal-protein-alanine N-acetyltransferase